MSNTIQNNPEKEYPQNLIERIIDDNNHAIDALRYALEPLIKTQPSTLGLRLDI